MHLPPLQMGWILLLLLPLRQLLHQLRQRSLVRQFDHVKSELLQLTNYTLCTALLLVPRTRLPR